MSPPSVTQELDDDGKNQSAVGTCTDLSGHEVTDKVTGINIDTTPPAMRLGSRTPANAAGWNRGDVVVTWTCADGLSGPEQETVSRTVESEGTDQTAIATCRDRAGNERSATEHGIDIDRTPPEPALVSRTPLPTSSGWNTTDVSIVWNCTDALSGVEPADRTVTETVTGDGRGLSATGRCHDRAGNVGANTQSVDIDKTAPTIAATRTPAANAKGWNDTDVTVSFTCADDTSGLAEPCPADVHFTNDGAGQVAIGKVTDAAGNAASAKVVVNIEKKGQ
jgi:hypothetical protein